jgi:hypothetical protein
MPGMGLNQDDRNYVAMLVHEHRSSEAVRDAVTHRVRGKNWSYQENVRFLGWLRGKGYDMTAERLAEHLEG